MRNDRRAHRNEKGRIMNVPGQGHFVGFGFGPIQTGLFLHEAHRSGKFASYTVAEVDASLVAAVRENGGRCMVNIAHADRIEAVELPRVTMLNPLIPEDREKFVQSLATADEVATALPSIAFYGKGGASSPASCLADGFARRTMEKPVVIYTAENHNHAAEALEEDIRKAGARPKALVGVQAVNTVIGKMSNVVNDPDTIRQLGLTALVPGGRRAVLVEAFNRILISRITLPGFVRRIEVFEEKKDLLPFEEAKLYGHNAIHLLLGLWADLRGFTTIAEARHNSGLMHMARAAFINEAGAGLIHKHRDVDPLFTPEGMTAYADDLLKRMVNPLLLDPVARVVRDIRRKLEWNDRLIGAIRLALAAGVNPVRLIAGARLARRLLVEQTFRELWPAGAWSSGEAEGMLARMESEARPLDSAPG